MCLSSVQITLTRGLLVQTNGDASAGHGLQAFVNNAHTAVRRRINNIVTDERTHSIFEMVLGLPLKSSPALDTSLNNQVCD